MFPRRNKSLGGDFDAAPLRIPRRSHSHEIGPSWVAYLLLTLAVAFAGHKVAAMFGPVMLLYVILAVIIGVIYAVVSLRSLMIPFLVLFASVGFLRFIWYASAPILPDMSLDRISLIWMTLVFASLMIYQRKPLRGPFILDILLFAHAAYIAIRVLTTNPIHFGTWTASVLTPYLIYFFAKNIVRTSRQIHMILVLFGLLSVYYSVTSISEKFHIEALLFPRMMAEPHPVAAGRSSGPFRSPGIFGDTMGMVLPVFLYFLFRAKNKFRMVLTGGALVLGFVGILFTYTRGSMLASIIGMGSVVLANRRVYLKYFLPVVLSVPLLAFTVIGVQQDKYLEERLEATNPIQARAGTLATALRLWKANPLFGCGSYQYKDHAGIYEVPVEVPVLGKLQVRQYRGSPAHDMYFGPLAEDGAVGAILQILIHVVILRTSIRKLRDLRKRGDYFGTYILPLFFGIYAIYFFGGMIISFRHFSILGSLYYMAAGITYAYNPDDVEDSTLKPELTRGG